MMEQHVLVVGLGGVGGICAEMIARGGVGRMTIVDADVVELSNCNRQIPALHSNEGRKKAEVMAERLKDINPAMQLRVLPMFLDGEKATELFRHNHYDYAVDCIDTLSAKVAFLKTCLAHQVPVVSSLGAGGKVDPSQVQVADISKTFQCKLAQAVRKKLHESNIYTGFKAIFSPEQVDQSKVIVSEKAFPKKSLIGTISYMPAIFGCVCASVVLRDIMNASGKK